jgi:heme exporter protein A
LTKPDAGTITLNGISAGVNQMQIRSQIGVVLHAPMLYGNLTGRENLRFFSRVFGVVNAETQIEQVLEEMNLTNRSGDLVRTYSRGMQQRLSIARAILHHPQTLLMDEPFTGLDEDSIIRLNSFLKRSAQAGISILFATHDLDRACGLATRVDILHEGTIRDSNSSGSYIADNLRERYHQVISPTIVDQAESQSK